MGILNLFKILLYADPFQSKLLALENGPTPGTKSGVFRYLLGLIKNYPI